MWTSPVPQFPTFLLTFTHKCSDPNQRHSQSALPSDFLLPSEETGG